MYGFSWKLKQNKMKLLHKRIITLLLLFSVIVMAGCQKMDRPELADDFARDTNPPGGPLKFFAALDGSAVDSIRATFGDPVNATYAAGASGQGYKGSATSYIKFPSSNDFRNSTSFTIAFWMKSPNPPAGIGAQFVFAQATSTDIWTRSDIFLLMEDAGQSNNGLAALKFYLLDQWLEFIGDYRIPILDDQWHHLAFVYDETTSKLTTYVDGQALTGLPANRTNIMSGGNPRGAADLSKSTGLIIGGPGHHATGATPDGWMVNYRGELDQFRMYDKPLTAAEVGELFSKRM